MPFGHGKNSDIYANGYDLTGYLDSIDQAATVDTAETTTFAATAKSYISSAIKAATIQAEGFFDGAAGAVDAVLSAALGAASQVWAWYSQGDTLGNPGYGMSAINVTYNVKGSISSASRIAVSAQSNTGIERILSLHALASEAASGNAASLDNGAASSNGGSAYIECTSATGTLACVVEHSTDNVTFTTLASFTNITTANKAERITFAGTVNRYVRAKWTITGGPFTFNVGINRI